MFKVGGIYTTSNYMDIIVKITDDKIYSYYINDVFRTKRTRILGISNTEMNCS